MTKTKFYLSGFGPFEGVTHNPTQVIMDSIKEYLSAPTSYHIDSIETFEVSMEGVDAAFPTLIETSTTGDSAKDKTIFVHFGVASDQEDFTLEKYGYNETNFRVPDQRGYQPVSTLISLHSPSSLCTTLPLEVIHTQLSEHNFPVSISSDPGRFLCNYLYFKSLLNTNTQNDTLGTQNFHSLFVHVPPFEVIPFEKQMEFVRELLNTIASTITAHREG